MIPGIRINGEGIAYDEWKDELFEVEMISYCLFCNTMKCGSIALLLPKRMAVKAISPRIVQRKWVKGKCFEEESDFLPGYVFLYADTPLQEFGALWSVDGVLRLLGRKEEGYRLAGEDKAFADMLYANEGMIGILKAYEVGDRIRLSAESLPGYEGEVIKVDRRKGRAQILIRFDEKEIKLWAGFDLISKVPEQQDESLQGM